MTLDELLLEWSYRSEKGYPSLDSPSDISVLKGILRELKLPEKDINNLVDSLEEEDKDTTIGTDGVENSPIEKEKQAQDKATSPEEVKNAIDNNVDTCDIDQLKAALDKLIAQGRLTNNNIDYMLKNIQNTCAYDPVLDALRRKGYGQKIDRKGNTTEHPIIKKYANEIKNLTLNATEDERDAYINYISDPSKQIDFIPKLKGNLYKDAELTGIPKSIINKLMMYVTTDSGNKGVGMGEFAMSLLFKNIGDAVGAGDLSLNGETFEIKGENATLGKRPDEINAIDVSGFAKYIVQNIDDKDYIDDKDLLFKKELRKTKKGNTKNVNIFYYKGQEVKKNTFAEIMSDIYNSSSNKEDFKNDFKEALRMLDTSNKEKHSEAIDEFFEDIDFTTPQGVQNGIALLNFYRYILKEKFQHFLAHDFGAESGTSTGDYVYAKGTAREMVTQLMGVATFQAISPDNLKPRIGFGGSMRENLITKIFY